MNLCLDVGNTRIKAAVFNQKGEIIYQKIYHELTSQLLYLLWNEHKIDAAILSSVRANNAEIEHVLSEYCNTFINLSHETPIPIKNDYETPKTLGKDRLAAVVGGVARFPNTNLLVIDAGTCITYDFIDDQKIYKGGAIAPGIYMKFKALHTFTDQLPLINPNGLGNLIGRTTRQSILSGVQHGTLAEVSHLIQQYSEKYPHLKVLITGGDAHFFETNLKSEIFALPHLVPEGLNQILLYNKQTVG